MIGAVDFYPIDLELIETIHEVGNIGASSLLKASCKYPSGNFLDQK